MHEHKKRCRKCKDLKPVEEFYKDSYSADGRNSYCIKCYQERRGAARTQIRATQKIWRRHIREEVIEHYGGKCACCGEDVLEFLAIDHINGGGGKHRKALRVGNFSWWLKKNGFPPGYRVLCHNCNLAKGAYGFCPHEPII